MKKIILLFILSLYSLNVTYAEIDSTVTQNIPGMNTTSTNSVSTGTTTVVTTVVQSTTNNIGYMTPFCAIPSVKKEVKNDITVKKSNNKYIVMTYLQSKSIKYSETKKNKTSIPVYELSSSDTPGSTHYSEYLEYEQECKTYRLSLPENNLEILNLYKQVDFISTYYSKYPIQFTKGIMPGFLLVLVDGVEVLSTWLLVITVLNLIVLSVIYIVVSDIQKQNWIDRLYMGLLYFAVTISIKLGVVGTLIVFVGYESLDIVNIFFIF